MFRTTLTAALAATIWTAVPAAAQEGGINPAAVAEQDRIRAIAAEERQAIVDAVVDHFRRNPGELVGAILDWRERTAPAQAAPAAIPVPVRGTGDVRVIEFHDYGCAPCKSASAAVDRAAAGDGAVAVERREFPVSGPGAVEAAVASLALQARDPASWRAFSSALDAAGGTEAPDVAAALAAAGAAPASASETEAAAAAIAANREMASRLGIKGLPALLVVSGDRTKAITGAVGEADLVEAFREVRGR